ncbi:MAG: hypothetical protein FJY67_12225 [Calditrichaeota bacterium]|nr:hypothetical protein [Calditrichota bacterium]
MRDYEFRYLTGDMVNQINTLIETYTAGSGSRNADELFDKFTVLLPIEKLNQDTVRRRVEGLYYASELLWQKALQSGKESRNDIVRRAGLKPLSHYHYMTGSREPRNIVLTRDDYLNDPATALVKLRDDILGIAGIIPSMSKN